MLRSLRARTLRAPSPPRRRRLARRLANTGNTAFFVGSLLFLSSASERAGVWLFVVGSAALLLASLLDDAPRD